MSKYGIRLRRSRLLKFGAIVTVGMLILASMIFRDHPTTLPKSMKDYQHQQLKWTSCYGQFQCSHLMVPIDYQKLGNGRFVLKVLRFNARNQKKKLGSLVINPGGPGASGVNYAFNSQYIFSPEILNEYDIVGFDPEVLDLANLSIV